VGSIPIAQLETSYAKAENILHRMPGAHDFIREDEAEQFAEELAKKMATHG